MVTGGSALNRRLQTLEATDLIRRAARVQEPEYIFRHALVQEAAYGAMHRSQRRAVHGELCLVIDWLASQAGSGKWQASFLARPETRRLVAQ